MGIGLIILPASRSFLFYISPTAPEHMRRSLEPDAMAAHPTPMVTGKPLSRVGSRGPVCVHPGQRRGRRRGLGTGPCGVLAVGRAVPPGRPPAAPPMLTPQLCPPLHSRCWAAPVLAVRGSSCPEKTHLRGEASLTAARHRGREPGSRQVDYMSLKERFFTK